MIPQSADQYYNADRVVASGAGLSLLPTELTAGAVRAEVRTLLGEPRYRTAAAHIRTEFVTMPSPSAARSRLVELAAGQAPLAAPPP